MIDTAARCGYSRCRAELPAPGPQGGRPRSFCRDTRWEGGRTCAQMARNERDALDALGLDGGGTAFRLDADRLREHVDAVRGPVGELAAALDAVTARLDEVQRDAVAAVEVAHRRAAESDAERVAAEAARERADEQAQRARTAAEQAAEDRDEAVRRAARRPGKRWRRPRRWGRRSRPPRRRSTRGPPRTRGPRRRGSR